jgi:alpha-galactosidase/6-phospho-beta-glucosidase family protein
MESETVDKILEWMHSEASKPFEDRRTLSAHEWIAKAQSLNILRSNAQEHYLTLKHLLAKKADEHRVAGMNASDRKTMIEAQEEYLAAELVKAKLERITDAIRLAKKAAEQASEGYSGF